jgi:hypothetical protein
MFSGKEFGPRVFSSRRIYRQKEDVRGGPGAHPIA